MNRYFIFLALLLFACFSAQAQSNYHNMHYLDPYNPEFVKGEVLVKFKDEVVLTTSKKNDVAQTGVASVDELLAPYQILNVSKVFKETREQHSKKPKRTIRDFKGKEMEVPALYNIYKLAFDTAWDVKQIVEALQADKQIAFAEPNYLVYTAEVLESGLVPDQALERPSLPDNKGTQNTFPNDPLYQDGSQWYLDAINAPAAWDSVTGDTSQIIAIIDTGVDWDHPDLDDNIWTNWDEIPGNGIDDDGNGYVDDVRGWDYINNDNDPNDDNSHGTHVAGIAAAEGNNGIGICGVAWNAKIMPVKMLQSSGTGNASDLASAIEYASDNGATVINMSLGSYGESLTVKTVLENAYAGTGDGEGSMLVAAAGNDGRKLLQEGLPAGNMFPACYSFVIGVQATNQSGGLAIFSNIDPSGPIEFWNQWGHNYEMKAPGVVIISCKPNGSYWSKNGTSMASPEVAGAVALMRQYQPEQSGEQIFAKLIQGSNAGLIDVYSSLTASLVPDLYYIDYTIVDTLPGCDGDGRADAGETIELYLTIKNAGGQADSVWAKLRFGQFEDTTTANIIDSTSYIGSMSAYSTMTGELDPFTIEIDADVANNRDIVFEFEIGVNTFNSVINELLITAQNGIELDGIIDSDITLYPNRKYIVNNSLGIINNATLTIKPGVQIDFSTDAGITCFEGKIVANGKLDSLITFHSTVGGWTGLHLSSGSSFSYCMFKDGKPNYSYGSSLVKNGTFSDCIFRDNIGSQLGYIFFSDNTVFMRCNFVDNFVYEFSSYGMFIWTVPTSFSNNNISHNSTGRVFHIERTQATDIIGGNIFGNGYNSDISFKSRYQGTVLDIPAFYYGKKDSLSVAATIHDFFDNNSLGIINWTNFLHNPDSLAHGIVWKVEINDILINKYDNPFNSTNGLGVIGAETLKFEVYFNRAMDTSYTPLLTFGVREPYTQHIVADSTSWSADSTIWTAYRSIDMTTGDGIQRVRVANARDNERFEIPIEDSRFEFVIQAAAAASIEFYATPGIGKVDLEWPPTPSEDALGYNLYRFYNLTDSTYSDTLMVNTELVLDTLFTDYNVIPDTTYHYLYKTLGTDMVETDYSKKATATPFSAANGDANGDLTVNVLDITTIVSYILNQNPQPFLSDAADVNYDGQINLLDIIGVVNLIMNQKAVSDRPYPMISQQKAYYEWQGNQLWLHSQGNVAGLQFDLALPENLEAEQLRIKSRLPGFEMASQMQAGNIQGLLFNLDGKTIPAGENCLLELIGAELPSELQFTSILGGELEGDLVEVLPYGIDDLTEQSTEQQMLQVQPNPFSHQLLISWDVPEANKVVLHLYDQQGRLIKSLYEGNDVSGNTYWEGKDQHNKSVSKGVYILRMELQQKEGLQSVERKIIFN